LWENSTAHTIAPAIIARAVKVRVVVLVMFIIRAIIKIKMFYGTVVFEGYAWKE
jgi:hypothetical protein